jgi:hypothetical protein
LSPLPVLRGRVREGVLAKKWEMKNEKRKKKNGKCQRGIGTPLSFGIFHFPFFVFHFRQPFAPNPLPSPPPEYRERGKKVCP